MSNTNFKIGQLDEEDIYLKSPSWDCSWYVGFGYLSNHNQSTHLDYVLEHQAPNKNMFDAIKEVFGESLHKTLKDEKNLWKFCELFSTWVNLKESYEIYNRGGSHYSTSDPDLKNFQIAEKILSDIFKVNNELCKLIGIDGLEYTKKITRDLYDNMFPTTFTQRKPTNADKRTWTLSYINIFDNPKNHSDKIAPKAVVNKWKKEKELKKEKVQHRKFTELFN